MAKSARDDRTRSEAIRELFEFNKKEAPMKTNTPPILMDALIISEAVETFLKRTPNITPDMAPETVWKKVKARPWLSELHREAGDRRRISKSGMSRKELTTVLTAQTREEVDELAI